MKICTIVGARPQFVKLAPVSCALRQCGRNGSQVHEVVIHTGQHYDHVMSEVFFEELEMDAPAYNLGVGSGLHGEQTGKMLSEIERVLISERPDRVLIYGDTNSTLAAALAACKLHVPIAHVEAGLRCFDQRVPEEVNRIIADHVSELLFAPTLTARENLRNEGITRGVHLVGDVMLDALLHYVGVAERRSTILQRMQLESKNFFLVTVHRPANTDDIERLGAILCAFGELARKTDLVWPVHPRTRRHLEQLNPLPEHIRLIEPVSYLDMLALERAAQVILTDSGGVQKEARWLNVPCVTLREETEWLETLENGWNRLAGADTARILTASAAARSMSSACTAPLPESDAAQRIAGFLTA